jgi:hypothetical protein
VLPSVRWSGDGDRLLVEDGSRLATDQRDRRLVLDLRTGRVDDAPAALRDPVRNAVAASGDGWLRIDPRSTVEVGADGEVASRKETQLWIAGFWGPAVARGTLLAQAAFGPGGENLVVVADTATGSVPVVLHAPMRVEGGWSKICCGPVTWLDDTTLLLDAQGHLLTWDVLSGALAWVADLPDLVVAVHRLG